MHGVLARTLCCLLLLAALSPAAFAATGSASTPLGVTAAGGQPARSPFGTPGRAAGPKTQQSGVLGWVREAQYFLHQRLAQALVRFKAERAFHAGLALALLSFGYGVLHAAGPGHGKAVITSYVLGNEQTVRRGIALSFAAALVQALAAVALVGVLAVLLNAAGLRIQAWSNALEQASYALVALVGLWLVVTQTRALMARRAEAAAAPRRDHTGHVDAQPHEQHPRGGPRHRDHHHDHHRACCGHAHAPDPQALQGPMSLKKAAAIVLAVGIRPCTGAILVLVFALAQGLFWTGVAATFAMALGTALTVSALAALAVGSRQLALRFAGPGGGWSEAIWTFCGIGSGALVLMLGTILFVASLGPARPF